MKGFKYAVRLVKRRARNSNSNCYKILNVFGTIRIFQIQKKQKCPATRKLALSVFQMFRMLMVRSSTSVLQIYKKVPPLVVSLLSHYGFIG